MNSTAELEAEAEFIGQAHDRQMAAKSPGAELYFRMHKEMTPSLVKIANEAMTSDEPQDQIANVLETYSRFVASNIVALVNMCGNPNDPTAARELAQILVDAVSTEASKYLAKREKTPINSE